MKKHLISTALGLALGLLLFISCEKETPKETPTPPVIEEIRSSALANETGEYKVKPGQSVTLHAVVENALNPIFSWKVDGKIVSTENALTFVAEKLGEYFVNFRVDAENGSAEKQVKISVLEKLPPMIILPSAMIAYRDIAKEFTAEAENAENATYVWRLDGKIVSESQTYTFNENTLGDYFLSLKVTTTEGQDLKSVTVTVLPAPLPELYFDNGRYRVTSNTDERRTMTVSLGKPLVMAPVIRNIDHPTTFVWKVDGAIQAAATTEYFTFTPGAQGTYLVSVTEQSTGATVGVEVTCTPPEGTYRRTGGVKNHATSAFYYIPAPGQYIGSMAGMTIASALQELQAWCTAGADTYHMIGSFGGYYIVGFDHSLSNVPNKADLQINGNPFAGWCESGIVWVMQDENGNGQPDDTWYELKGSETGKSATKQRYALTYYKPKDLTSSVVAWTDNMGKSGAVTRGGYPRIIAEDYYTLTGTCLASTVSETGISYSECYEWGYVDGINSSPLRPNTGQFWLEDAIQQDGSPANLQYIDFVKVHTAINSMTQNVGEISTEACMPYDLNF
jgi:hypothetical protein